jgi:hypothetical protein
MKFKSIVSITIPFLFLLASCDSQSFVTQTPSLVTKSTPTNLPSGTATLNFKPAPSVTLSPADATEVYFRFTAVPATIEARGAKCKEGFALERSLYILDYSTNQWTVFTCSPIPANRKDMWTPGFVDFGTRYTQLIKTDFSQTWTIQHNEFNYSVINRPDAMLIPKRWTFDGNDVYLAPKRYPGRDYFNAYGYFYDDEELLRLNLNSGKLETILPYAEGGYSYSLSPNDQFLAYSLLSEKKIVHIKNMDTGVEQRIELNGDYALTGMFAWSPDGTRLYFASALNGWDDGIISTSLFGLTIKDKHLQAILNRDSRFIVPSPRWENKKAIYWTNENYLYIDSLNSTEFFNSLALDVQSGKVIVLATPQP